MLFSLDALRAHYRWVIVAAGGVLGCVAIGGLFSLPVLLRPIAQDTGWAPGWVAAGLSVGLVVAGLVSRRVGRLIDAIWFNHVDMLPERVTLAYRLSLDEWQGQQRVQYVVEASAEAG